MSSEPAQPTVLPLLRARAGLATLGRQVVVHGKDLHHECLEQSFVQYFLFCVTGRVFEARAARVFEQLWISTGYPDARIWCNRVAGYLGSARVDPGLSLSAAIAASNSVAYGFVAMRRAFALQAEIPEDVGLREAWFADKLEQKLVLSGYGRPVHGSDERIAVGLKILLDAGYAAGPALKRAFWLRRRLKTEKGIELNAAGFWSAVALDFGLNRAEYEGFMLLMFAPGYAAVYADQRARPAFEFLRGYQTRA